MNRKNNMLDLTFCIPIRIDSEYRMRNLLAVLEFYSHYINANYILIEADKEQRIHHLPNIPNLRYHYIYDENIFFHRTHYINKMLSETSTKIAAIWDTDVVAPVSQLRQAYEKIMYDGKTMVYPYDGCFWNVNDFYSNIFCEHKKNNILTNMKMPRYLMAGYYSVGGAFLVNVQSYKSFGWENESFIGWGPEDVERYHRMQILGECSERINGALYHLYHTRGINSGYFNEELALKTKKELIHVCGMRPDELRKYIKTWNTDNIEL